MTRRAFLVRLSRLGAGTAPLFLGLPWRLSIGRRSLDPRGATKRPVIPPGSRSLGRFTSGCTACHRCITACPTRVLQPSLAEYGAGGLFQPVLDFSVGYCDYLCTACGRACPTAAIDRISVGEKKRLKIGSVFLVKEDCIVFTRGTPCGACAEICPTQAVRMAAYRPGLPQPVCDSASCVGCGACEFVCPARPRKAIYVVGVDPHSTALIPDPAPPAGSSGSAGGLPEEAGPPKEFPF